MSANILIALFNGAWQGAVLCLFAGLALRFCRNQNATTLFAIWTSIWVVCIALPVADYAFGTSAAAGTASAPLRAVSLGTNARADRALEPPSSAGAPKLKPFADGPLEKAVAGAKNWAGSVIQAFTERASLWLAILAVVAGLRVTLVARDVFNMLAARRQLTRLSTPEYLPPLARPIWLASSSHFSSPCVLGFWPAVIVVPDSMLSRSAAELRSVILHEFEHARRFDDVQNVIARVFTSLAFFCPGALIAIGRITLYREQICDDAAIVATSDAVSYAKALAAIAHDMPLGKVAAPGLFFRRNDLLQRVRVLLDRAANHSLVLNRPLYLAGAAALAVAALFVVQIRLPSVAAVPSHAFAVALNPTTFAGTFSLWPCTDNRDQAMLDLEYHSYGPGSSHSDQVTRCISYSQFRGFQASDLASQQQVARRTFDIVRDEGTMHAVGTIGKGAGTGTWTYVPSSTFGDELRSRGVDTPAPRQQFIWMMSDFRLATIDRILRSGFDQPTLQDLVMLSYIGDTDGLVDAAAKAPGPKHMRDLVRAAQLGMSSEFISGFNALGFHLTLGELVRCREFDVTPAWVQRHFKTGQTRPTVDQLIRARSQPYPGEP